MKRITSFYFASILVTACCSYKNIAAQAPTPRQLFQKMKESIDAIRTISYDLDFRNVNHGVKDSVFAQTSRTFVKRVPADTVLGAYVHLILNGTNGRSEYYYDGNYALDIYHQSPHEGHSKTITTIEPYKMSNGINSIQARTSFDGLCKEMIEKEISPYWQKYIDSMSLTDGGNAWLIRWQQYNPAQDYLLNMEVGIDKKTSLICTIRRQTVWQSVPMNYDVVIRNLRINTAGDEDSILLKETYADYKVTNQKKPSGIKKTVASPFIGTPALEVSYQNFSGSATPLVPAKGQFVLLDFWETWCGYCFAAMPKVKALHEKYASKGLNVVGVTAENKEQIRKVVEQKKFPYPTVFADEQVINAYKVDGRPRYILIDDAKTVIADEAGDLEAIEKVLEAKLK